MTIPWAKPLINKKDIQYLNKAVNSQWIAKGEYVQNFEKKLNFFFMAMASIFLDFFILLK